MAKGIVGGRKPLSSKQKPTGPLGVPDFFKNPFAIPDDILADVKAKGMECRWISYKEFVANGNSHGKGWVLYKAAKREGVDSYQMGNGPDGIVQRKEMVLAVRKKEHCDQHRAYLRQRAGLQTTGFKKSKADELRELAAQADLSVHEGYEEQTGDTEE